MPPSPIKPTHKSLAAYYQALQAYAAQDVTHEGALETAFQRLLNDTAKPHGLTLIPKQAIKRGGRTIYPDGTLRDEFNLAHGYWEAKDTDDDLSAEIRKKTASGYPLNNIIFEDTRAAVLFQNGGVAFEADLSDPRQLADLLNAFYSHTEPDIEGFEQAVGEFKERVPELAQGLAAIIKTAHRDNAKFQAAFAQFLTVCRAALNPNLSEAAVDEMLVQHLLTERLIRKIFDNPEFTQRNVIAAEVERVIGALVTKSFNRDEFLKSLDRFYRAIELAAQKLEDFTEKQHFLNTVYERFFQGYSVKVADTHGIVYTPQPIVDFMCASVVEVLQSEFGKSLGDREVQILDPCTGTGNFIVNLLRRIPKRQVPRVYREQLFANEVMLLPYYIAALNIEHAYYELTGEYEPFDGLCFVDTLDLAEKKQHAFDFMGEDNTARVEREKNAPITVIIGNPPYNVGQLNENDNNKNRKYDVVDGRIRQTYAKDSKAKLKAQLYDPYVKFFRWATDRLNSRDGIVCFVSNNSFVDQIAFDGMRAHLERDFSRIYHLHLEGNVRENPKLAGTAYNVFGIQVGVGITIAIRRQKHRARKILFHRVSKRLRRFEKLEWLSKHPTASSIKWTALKPDERRSWLKARNGDEFAGLVPISGRSAAGSSESLGAIFDVHSPGINSGRDSVVYDFDAAALTARVERLCDDYNAEVDRYQRKRKVDDIDAFVDYSKIKWSETLKRHLQSGENAEFDARRIKSALYRPFTKRHLYYDQLLNDRPGLFRRAFPDAKAGTANTVLAISDIGYRANQFSALVVNCHADMHLCAAVDAHQCFPFYIYNEGGTNRRENITDWALDQFRTHYKDKKIDKWAIFHYVYGLLHHAGYRERFADNLKRELPRIPLAPDFAPFSRAGRDLARLHLDYESLDPWPLDWIEAPGVPLSYHVDKMKLTKDKSALIVNPSLTLANIPPETFRYRLGNRSALDWVIDQYQISEDKRSGIRSNPNRADDPEYIVRLVGQVVRVSVETVKIVEALPGFR